MGLGYLNSSFVIGTVDVGHFNSDSSDDEVEYDDVDDDSDEEDERSE